jgi:hypothetical protein
VRLECTEKFGGPLFGFPAGRKLRAEVFNVFNWVNLGDPETRITRATFGRITSAIVNTTAGSRGPPRVPRLSVRIEVRLLVRLPHTECGHPRERGITQQRWKPSVRRLE